MSRRIRTSNDHPQILIMDCSPADSPLKKVFTCKPPAKEHHEPIRKNEKVQRDCGGCNGLPNVPPITAAVVKHQLVGGGAAIKCRAAIAQSSSVASTCAGEAEGGRTMRSALRFHPTMSLKWGAGLREFLSSDSTNSRPPAASRRMLGSSSDFMIKPAWIASCSTSGQ